MKVEVFLHRIFIDIRTNYEIQIYAKWFGSYHFRIRNTDKYIFELNV